MFKSITRVLIILTFATLGLFMSQDSTIFANSVSEDNVTTVTETQYQENIQGVQQVSFYQYLAKMNDRQAKFYMFMGYKECPFCRAFSPTLKQFMKTANLPVYYLNMDESFNDVPDSDLGIVLNTFNPPYKYVGTPTVLLVVHSKIVNEKVGSNTSLNDLNQMRIQSITLR